MSEDVTAILTEADVAMLEMAARPGVLYMDPADDEGEE
jgi:hypothetical protein